MECWLLKPFHALIEEVLAALDTEGLSQKAVNELAVGVILFLDINPIVNLRVDCGAVSLIMEQHLGGVGHCSSRRTSGCIRWPAPGRSTRW